MFYFKEHNTTSNNLFVQDIYIENCFISDALFDGEIDNFVLYQFNLNLTRIAGAIFNLTVQNLHAKNLSMEGSSFEITAKS